MNRARGAAQRCTEAVQRKNEEKTPTLKELRISRNESSQAQQLLDAARENLNRQIEEEDAGH